MDGMKIRRARDERDWWVVSGFLERVAGHLSEMGAPLWNLEQLQADQLSLEYELQSLHFFQRDEKTVGCVFLQDRDPLFWPEMRGEDALYVHKLAVDPALMGFGLGRQLLQLILLKAQTEGRQWLRLDCDDREPLHRFYRGQGFQMLDFKEVNGLRVARYQKSVAFGFQTRAHDGE